MAFKQIVVIVLGRRLTEINAKKREAKLTENNAFLSHLQIVHGLKNQVVTVYRYTISKNEIICHNSFLGFTLITHHLKHF